MGRLLVPLPEVMQEVVVAGNPDRSSVSFIISSIAFILCEFSIFTSCFQGAVLVIFIFKLRHFYKFKGKLTMWYIIMVHVWL